MSGMDLVPIGTILSLLVDQVLLTANAINDVFIEKECFKTLSKYLFDIEPILVELQHHELTDTQAVRHTLEFLKENCHKAEILVQKYKNCGRFYSFLFCRHIANEIQDATRAIGKSLAMLPLANTEVLSETFDKVNRLQAEMQKAEYVVSQSSLMILEKLEKGIKEEKHDQNLRNSMLEQIALSVGLSFEPSEIRKELDYLRIDKEEAASRKEKQEEVFLKQVIELLSNADAARGEDEIRKQYELIKNTVEKSAISNGKVLEYGAYRCPITHTVMVDPVDLITGTTCERAAIEAWFLQGRKEDPLTGQPLADTTVRPNIYVKQSIQQWREQNDFLKIRQAKETLKSDDFASYEDAFSKLSEVAKERMVTKYWISMEGLIDIIVHLMETLDCNLKSRSLQTLLVIVDRHSHNKHEAVEAGVLRHIVESVGLDSYVCVSAANLLFELLQENDKRDEDCRWNEGLCQKLKQQRDTIAFLVVNILDNQFSELMKKLEDILLHLCCDDDETILTVASYRWYKPLVQQLYYGTNSSKQCLMRGLQGMQLVDEDLKHLGEDGVINPLATILSSKDAESRELSLSILSKLSTLYKNKKLFLEAGAVSTILEQISSPHFSLNIREKSSEIFENLTSGDSEFATMLPEKELIIANLMTVLESSTTSIGIRKPVLKALLSICSSANEAAEKGISCILPLLEDPDNEIRKLALEFLHRFCLKETDRIADSLLQERRLETLVAFLSDDGQPERQLQAVGLLANLQMAKGHLNLIENLADLRAIPMILSILNKGNMEAKEHALTLLSRFLNPSDIAMQKRVVESGVYPLLVSILTTGSNVAKGRAAALIGNLSSSSPKLTKPPNPRGCFCLLGKQTLSCELHGGICSANSSFCPLKADAITPLVALLRERDDDVKLNAVLAMGTLVEEGFRSRGAELLHRLGAIRPLISVLGEGNPIALKERALEILERVFMVSREVSDTYGEEAKIPLIKLVAHYGENANANMIRKADKLLNELQLYSKSGSLPL